MEQGWEMYSIIEKTIDHAFKGKFMVNMYDYLKQSKATKKDVQEFNESSTSKEIQLLIIDLEDYIEGGSDSEHKQLREAYGYLGKTEARKVKDYLNKLLQDALRYEQEKRPGRKKKPSK